ncbi:hypothetical protein VOLCADRAFT_99766 [Volvox carteri f. nagariensis]|uniref:Uncharacterized protein n=1 Tax=Volvox carteri f. nagariensis TaxID=3068 RepID=D8UIL2_VOLCA|nr:uncharacterized protein VOLCADRAFT_99766 [Volvox carteri f. nagariensis]EFJ40414.1 hypothetical protein VOLCADRAFT_99766 [Volvox carteri f. nagariensis]|eukprot:XP_002958494.1 hypothetical protein VOLCADRAFT_99766 [Volvox carteri f. nagariensis]
MEPTAAVLTCVALLLLLLLLLLVLAACTACACRVRTDEAFSQQDGTADLVTQVNKATSALYKEANRVATSLEGVRRLEKAQRNQTAELQRLRGEVSSLGPVVRRQLEATLVNNNQLSTELGKLGSRISGAVATDADPCGGHAAEPEGCEQGCG